MKKFSNKILIIGLVVLIAVFVTSRFYRSPGLESNLRKDLVKLDTALINEVRILPAKDRGEEIKLLREGHLWKAKKGTRTEASNAASVKSLLGVLVNLQAQRLASRKKEKWNEFNVGETGTHVTVYQDGKLVADFHVGKLGFVKSNTGSFAGAYTYVRLTDENEVYTVDGFLESSFNNSFSDWRDKTFLKLNKSDISKISFHYALDSGFVLEKRDSVWYVGNEKADPAKAENLANAFSSKYLTDFVEGFTSNQPADASIRVDGKAGNLLTVDAWKKDKTDWILTSSIQKGIYFSNKGSTIINDILVGKKRLLPK